MIKIFTDSTTGLPLDVLTEYGINVLPMKIVLNGTEYLETSITNENLYETLEKFRKAPEVIPPSVDEIAAAFEAEIVKGNEVLAIFMSEKMNKIYENASRAKINLKTVYPKASIHVIDSKSTSMQQGLAVYDAARMVQDGASIHDVTREVKQSVNRSRLYLVPKSFKYFDICGLLKKHHVAVSNILQLFPILFVQDGNLIVQNIIQSKNKAISKTVKLFETDNKIAKIDAAIVLHIEDFERASKLAEQIRKISDAEVNILDIGAVVGASLGPGTLGLVYKANEELPVIVPKFVTNI